MAKVTPSTITGAYASTSELNANFALLAAEFENVPSRDGASPSAMTSELDMNGYNIINVGELLLTVVPPSQSQDLFAPGYSYSYVSDTTFTVDLVDATIQFKTGRRIRFDEGTTTSYGTISIDSNYNSTAADDTFVTVVMENSGVVPATIEALWFVSSDTNWAPIAEDPMGGLAINDIETGIIGSTQWWIIIGDGGALHTSTNGGVTWTARTSGTTGKLYDATYDSLNETFYIVGKDSAETSYYMGRSTDGITWSSVTFSLETYAWATNDFLRSICYNGNTNQFRFSTYDASTPRYRSFTSRDAFASTALYTNEDEITPIIAFADPNASSVTGASIQIFSGSLTYYDGLSDITPVVLSTAVGTWSGASQHWVSSISEAHMWAGESSGRIMTRRIDAVGSEVRDTTTFSYAINDFAHSTALARSVCVGDNAQIGYISDAVLDAGTANAWTPVVNGFNPASDVLAVAYNEGDGVFVAVADDGVICRSTTGVT